MPVRSHVSWTRTDDKRECNWKGCKRTAQWHLQIAEEGKETWVCALHKAVIEDTNAATENPE